MIVSVDTSALAKLLVEEAESSAVREYLIESVQDQFVMSTIAVTELRCLAIRLGAEDELVELTIRPFRVVQLTEGMIQSAGRLPHRELGTLDAIHIATALNIQAAAFVSFDARQLRCVSLFSRSRKVIAVSSPRRRGDKRDRTLTRSSIGIMNEWQHLRNPGIAHGVVGRGGSSSRGRCTTSRKPRPSLLAATTWPTVPGFTRCGWTRVSPGQRSA